MKQLFKRLAAAALCLTLALAGAVDASAQSVGIGGVSEFSIEQVYVNVPEMDIFAYALDENGESLSPALVSAAGVTLTLGDKTLPTGTVTMADEAILYIFLLDNGPDVSETQLAACKTAILQTARRKEDRDQVMVYTLSDSACACPATTELKSVYAALRNVRTAQTAGDVAAAAAKIAADVNNDFSSLAPRKTLFACTSTAALIKNPAMLAALIEGDTLSQLNMSISAFAATESETGMDALSTLTSGRLIVCYENAVGTAVAKKQDALKQALEIKTNVSTEDGGQKMDLLTLSVPSLGSAVRQTATVYMGHALEQPAVESVAVLDRTHLQVRFNQAVQNAGSPKNYTIRSTDVWSWNVPVLDVSLSADGRTAALTVGRLYEGNYQAGLHAVTSRVSTANTCTSDKTAFTVAQWARDQQFYLDRFRTPALVLLLALLALFVSGAVQRRRDRAAEAAAEAQALLENADVAVAALPRRWLTMYVRTRGSIADKRVSIMVEGSLVVGSDGALCDLCLPDVRVKPQHCMLCVEGEDIYLQPLEKCIVRCNKERVVDRHKLKNEDVITLGGTRIQMVL